MKLMHTHNLQLSAVQTALNILHTVINAAEHISMHLSITSHFPQSKIIIVVFSISKA